MAQQLLWIETLLKFSGGVVLVLFPLSAARALGLPKGDVGLWPRLLGAVLIGLSAATFLEGQGTGPRGVGLGGLFAVNLSAAILLIVLLGLGRAAGTVRGRFILWMLLIMLLGLSALEFLYA